MFQLKCNKWYRVWSSHVSQGVRSRKVFLETNGAHYDIYVFIIHESFIREKKKTLLLIVNN